jgi:hypothetical protein
MNADALIHLNENFQQARVVNFVVRREETPHEKRRWQF